MSVRDAQTETRRGYVKGNAKEREKELREEEENRCDLVGH